MSDQHLQLIDLVGVSMEDTMLYPYLKYNDKVDAHAHVRTKTLFNHKDIYTSRHICI